MRILADHNVTKASITATNIIAASFTEKLKTFPLADAFYTLSNTTQIDLDFGTDTTSIDTIGLCGSNLTPTATVTITYADVDINTPDGTATMTTFSTFNQMIFIDSAVTKRYMRIVIDDSANTTLQIGYLYLGKYHQVTAVQFSPTPSLDIFSNKSTTPTGQRYGGKLYSTIPLDFTMYTGYDELESYLSIKEDMQDVNPVLLVQYIESYGLKLYRPLYGVLTGDSTPYSMAGSTLRYEISDRLEEMF